MVVWACGRFVCGRGRIGRVRGRGRGHGHGVEMLVRVVGERSGKYFVKIAIPVVALVVDYGGGAQSCSSVVYI